MPGHDELRSADDRAGQLRHHGPRARRSASTSSTPPTCTAGSSARASPSRSSAAGSPRAAGAGTRSCWPPRSTARWATGPTSRGCRPGTSSPPARSRCAGCRPTRSTSTRCTTSPGPRRGRRSGRRWRSWSRRARCATSGRPTSPAGTSPRRRSRPSRRHFLGLVSEQCIYNLLTRHVELEVVPAAQAYGIGIIPWSPLHGGLLSGALRKLAEGTGGRSRPGRSAGRAGGAPGGASRRTRSSAPTWARNRPTWRWPGCCPGRA